MKATQLCWLALAGLGAAAQAQNGGTGNIRIYGMIDANIQYGDSGRDKAFSLQNGGLGQSRLGFTGSEDLGAGLKAVFTIENGFNVDTGAAAQGGLLFGRQAFVGLSSTTLGTLTLGRQYLPLHQLHTKFSTHQAGFGDSNGAFIPTINDIRFDNSIRYLSPAVAGMTLSVFYALGENTTLPSTSAPDKHYGSILNVQWNLERGPFLAALSHADKKKTPSLPDNRTAYTAAAMSYDFGVLRPYLIVEAVRNDTVTPATPEFDFGSLAVDVRVGRGTINASVGRLRNRSMAGADATSYGLVYDYALSKRTSLYTGYARVDNGPAAAYFVGSGNNIAVAAAGNGADPSAIVLGLRHIF